MSEMGEVIIPVKVDAREAFRGLDREVSKVRSPVIRPVVDTDSLNRLPQTVRRPVAPTQVLPRIPSADALLARAGLASALSRARPGVFPLGAGMGAGAGAGARRSALNPDVRMGELRALLMFAGLGTAIYSARQALETYAKVQKSALPPDIAARQTQYLASTTELGFALRSLQVQGVNVLVPALTDLANWVTDVIEGNGQQFLQWLGTAAAALKVSALATVGAIEQAKIVANFRLSQRELNKGDWKLEGPLEDRKRRLLEISTNPHKSDEMRTWASTVLGHYAVQEAFNQANNLPKAMVELGDWLSGRKKVEWHKGMQPPDATKVPTSVDRDMGTFSGIAAGKIAGSDYQDRMVRAAEETARNTRARPKADPAIKAVPGRKYTGEEKF